MKPFFFRDFLSRFDGQGVCACACGQVHRVNARSVHVQNGALEASADLLKDGYGPGARLWVLSDENTEQAAGSRWKSAVRAGRITSRVLPARPRPRPTLELAHQLADEVRSASPDLLVGVGSGVICDLAKRVSLETGLPNWAVATAASVDAFSSGTAAITVKGYHGSLPARASETIVCDLDVIGKAPREMFLGGLGDLLAKYIAHLDWNLSRIMTGEHYCPMISGVALESARSALFAARTLRDDPAEAIRALTDAAVSSGFAMQASMASRSAASAEHTLAHFWESVHAVTDERLDLHGILVGAASRIVCAAYRALYDRLQDAEPDVRQRLEAYDAEPPWRETLEEGLVPHLNKVQEEMDGRRFDRGILAQRLESFRTERLEILALGRSTLQELGAAVEVLEGLRYPFSLCALGITREQVTLPMRNIRLLRRRYSGFELAYELGLEGILRSATEGHLAAAP